MKGLLEEGTEGDIIETKNYVNHKHSREMVDLYDLFRKYVTN